MYEGVSELARALQDNPAETADALMRSQHILDKVIDKYSVEGSVWNGARELSQQVTAIRQKKEDVTLTTPIRTPGKRRRVVEEVSKQLKLQREFESYQAQLRAEYQRLVASLQAEGSKLQQEATANLRKSYANLAQHKKAGQTYVDSAVKAVRETVDAQIRRLNERGV